MDNAILQMLITAVATFLAASGGFWVYLRKRFESASASNKLLLGLAHYRIVELGMIYIQNGFVTKDEYDDLILYFYEPYLALGGNGSVERIMRLVQRLPLTLSESDMNQVATAAKIRSKKRDGEKRIPSSDDIMRSQNEDKGDISERGE